MALAVIVGFGLGVLAGPSPLGGGQQLQAIQSSQTLLTAQVRSISTQLADIRAGLRQPRNLSGPGPAGLPSAPLPLTGASIKGNPEAPVAIVEYTDFQCKFCQSFVKQTLPELDAKYFATGKVQLVLRNLPLEQIHPDAMNAAKAAECAGRQNKFWPMHDLLFSDPSRLDHGNLLAYGAKLGLPMPKFTMCLTGNSTVRVRNDLASAEALGLSATPTFLIGTVRDNKLTVSHRLDGAQSLAAFRAILDPLVVTSQATNGTRGQ